jgi:hypothetical protein
MDLIRLCVYVAATDKCGYESMCLRFDQYMQLADQQYQKYNHRNEPFVPQRKIASIILSSESSTILSRRHNYTTSSKFPFRFVLNENDVGQGHGDPNRYETTSGHANITASQIMVSTMVALKMQLMAKYSVVNCCSGFHRMMLDLLRSGCGVVTKPVFQCLQDMNDPQFHVCCGWEHTKRCKTAREAFQKVYQERPQDYSRR